MNLVLEGDERVRNQLPLKHRSLHWAQGCCIAALLVFAFGLSDSAATPKSLPHDETRVSTIQVVQRLVGAGWTEEAAQAVAALNQDYFAIQSEYPSVLERTLLMLQRLGKYPSVMIAVARHPELAALLAGTPQPRTVADAFADEACFGAVAGMFQVITEPYEQERLAIALADHRRTICSLAAHGVPLPASLFMFPRTSSGADEYARWLDEALDQAMSAAQVDELLSSVVAVALNQGADLRRRMNSDDEFRRTFRTQLWPAFVRVADCSRKPKGECDTSFELIADEPRVWDLLMLPEGELLLERRGLLSVELLVDDPDGQSFPPSLRPLAHDMLLTGNDSTLTVLLRFWAEPSFRQVALRQDLDSDLRERVLADIAQKCPPEAEQCPELNKRLNQIANFSLATLREDLAPPPDGPLTWLPLYSSYYLAKKLAQGRQIDAVDLVFAALDIAAVNAVFSAGGKIITQTIKQKARKTLAEKTTETIALQTAKKASPTSAQLVARSVSGGRLISAMTKQYLQPLVAGMQRAKPVFVEATQIDITQPLQWMFYKTNVGRESIKRLTGMEARVFMRRDARVVIRPASGKFAPLIQETAANAGIATTLEAELTHQALERSVDFVKSWQQHASVWWLSNLVPAL
jgi:hypothetical protein